MSMLPYFAYNPFQKRTKTRTISPQGDQDTWTPYEETTEYWGLSDILKEKDAWRYENWSNPSNFQILDGDAETGYSVKVKTGDKEGTIYHLIPDGKGGFTSAPATKQTWNTNENLFDDRMAVAMMLAVGVIGAGAAGAFNQLGLPGASGPNPVPGLGPEFGGSVLGEITSGAAPVAPGAATGAPNPLYDLSVGNSLLGPGTQATTGLGVPTNMSGTALLEGTSLVAPGSTLGPAGLGGPAALAGVNSFAPAFTVPSIPPTQANWFGIPEAGFPGAQIPPGFGLDNTTALPVAPGNVNTFPPGTMMPGGNPLGTPGGGEGLPLPQYPAPPGTPGSNLPNVPGSGIPGSPDFTGPPAPPSPPGSGGNNTNNGTSAVSLLDWLIRAYDAYNKGNRQEENADEMFRWANKIFGRSGDFESMLMNTYTNPSGWLEGPEGMALNRIVQNQALRTDSRAGNLSNDTNRSVVLQDQMMKGLGNYRTGLGQSAALGRNASAVALDAVGKALQSETNASQWYTPLTYGAGQNGQQTVGGTITDLWNQVKGLGGIAQDAWNWLSGLNFGGN